MTTVDYSQAWASGPQNQEVPNYYYGTDNHNYGNGNFAFTDPSTWGTGLDNAGKFVVASAVSGFNGIANSAIKAANWVGADIQENDTAAQLAAIDDDLGKYYQNNKDAVDMAGFVISSLVPGLAGVKILNAGQKMLRAAEASGYIGANLSRVTGLLAPKVEAYSKLASADIATSSSTFSAVSSNTIKALTAGYGQAALESAAFETAVAATSFASPTLENQDLLDITKNIAMGGVVGGVIGGAINHAVTLGTIKKATKSFNPAEKLFADTTDIVGATPAQRIMLRSDRLASLPEVPTAGDIIKGEFKSADSLLKDLSPAEQAGAAEGLSTKLGRLKDETVRNLNNKNRMDMHELTGGKDKDLANILADQLTNSEPTQVFANLEHLTELGRVNTPLAADKEIEAFNKSLSSKKNIIDIENPPTAPAKIGYVKLTGENTGDMQFEFPSVVNLADTMKSPQEVLDFVKKQKFSVDTSSSVDFRDITDHLNAEARYIWADRDAYTINGMKIGEYDIPLLEKAVLNKVPSIQIASKTDGLYNLSGPDAIYQHLQQAKMEVASSLQDKGLSTDAIAKITNVQKNFLNGEVEVTNGVRQNFARQSAQDDYANMLRSKGIYSDSKVSDFDLMPSYAKVSYDTKDLKDMDGNIISGMAYIKANQKAYQQSIDAVVATHAPEELFNQMVHPTDTQLLTANRYGAGPGLASFANGGYGTLESWAEQLGSTTSRLQKYYKDNTSSALESSLYKLATKQEAAVEFESLNKYIQSTGELYGITPDGSGIAPLKVLDWKDAVASGKKNLEPPILGEGVKDFVPINNPEVLEAWTARTQLTGARTAAFQDIRNAQGLTDAKDPRALRPVRYDPKDYPHFALVVDDSITGVGHKSMIHAASPKELDEMISKVPPQYTVLKKAEAEQYFKAHGEFDYERTLHENYIDASLRNNGVNNPFFIRTDPQKIASSILQDHLKSDDIFARELVNAKFEKEFSFLRQQGEQYTSTATSKYLGSYREIESTTKNPYLNYVKTSLNLSQVNEHPLLMGLNNTLDKYVSQAYNTISDAFTRVKNPTDLDNVNNLLQKYGVNTAYYDAATNLLANHSAPKGELLRFVGRANSLMSTLVTRLDPFNALNNVIGSTVLYGSETKSVLRAIQNGDSNVIGELSSLLQSPAPTSAGLAGQESVMSAGKLFTNAIKNFYDKEATTATGVPLKDFYQQNGWTSRLTQQYRDLIDNLTLTGTESVSTLNSKISDGIKLAKDLAEKGEYYTGNRWAEEFNRFVSADTMRQITDIGVKSGLISPKEQLGYINTFVNRTQGNVLASQRPLMFQGAVGQAIGLFQTFQFNTMQQLFRHISEGSAKDTAMLLGLQGTMYGMNGLPAFNFLNTHIVGTMSGNVQHQDLYTSTYGITGKNIGDLLLYGLPSKMMQANLYSRGDINPRQLSIVPVNPSDIPFVSATVKAFDDVKGTMSKIANGGNIWESVLQGIEHNGLSRPLAGIAQSAQAINSNAVFATNNKGNMSGANDLWSVSTAIRLAGGKPFDEALANDAVYRMSAYQAADRQKVEALNDAIKSSVIGNETATPEQVQGFAEKYAALGGKQTNFNKYMLKQLKESNTVKANQIVEALKSPYSQKMQQIMGGDNELLDGRGFSQ